MMAQRYSCVHQLKNKTRQNSPNANLQDQIIWPYTDLLLHNMGPGLVDKRPEGHATDSEWRSPPL
ncbi:MAG: hypothetical protein TECD_00483 [Hyphomicrobiaceae bacterium hypho_1]